MSERNRQMKAINRAWPLLAGCSAILLITLIGCGGWLLWSGFQPDRAAAKMERLIQAEVHLGWDVPTTKAWCDSHGIQHSWSEDTTSEVHDNKGRTMPERAGLRSSDLSGMLRGEINGQEGISASSIRVYFFFDKHNRLVGHVVDLLVYVL